MKTFCGLKGSVTPYSSLNTSKGIVCCLVLSKVTNDDIKEGMAEQGVTDVRRITVRRDGIMKPTYTFVLIFTSPNYNNKCGRHAVCCNCGEPEHCGPSGVCDKPAKCVNCSGDHPANSK